MSASFKRNKRKNKRKAGSEDAVYSMSVHQRLDHLLCGFLRSCFHKVRKYSVNSVPSDIVILCIGFTGISKQSDYHLIKSDTEIKQEAEQREKANMMRKKRLFDEYTWYATPDIKVMIMGSGGVGKTSLNVRFETGDFLEEYDPTIDDGYRYSFMLFGSIIRYITGWNANNNSRKQVEVDGRSVNYDILDTAGQDEFVAVRQEYMREHSYYLLVYTITSRSTFEELSCFLEQINRVKGGEEWYGVIAGNKCDLEDMRQVSTKEGAEFAAKHANLKFMETSAKCKINVEEAFYECARWQMYEIEMYKQEKAARERRDTNTGCACFIL